MSWNSKHLRAELLKEISIITLDFELLLIQHESNEEIFICNRHRILHKSYQKNKRLAKISESNNSKNTYL